MASLFARWRIVGAVVLAVTLGVLVAPIAFNLPSFAAVFVIGLIFAGLAPFCLGFLAQWIVGRRAIPEYIWLVSTAVLMLPWWLWGKGFAIAVPGPRISSLLTSAVYLMWFMSFGADAARQFGHQLASNTPTHA